MNARLCLVLSLLLALPLVAGGGLGAAPPPAPDHAQVAQALHRAPLLFIQNVGQFDPRARFQVRGGNGALWLAEDALWITLLERREPDLRSLEGFGGLSADDQPRQGVNVKLSFIGANPHPRLEPFNRLETHVSYFIGNDPTKWYADVPVWSGVRYVDLYPGIDLEVSGEGGQWQPRILAQPGVDVSQVHLRVEGADDVALEGDHLRLTTAVGPLSLPPVLTGDGAPLQPGIAGDSITFTPHPFHPVPASVDSLPNSPTDLVYSTYLGGGGDDCHYGSCDIALDAAGAAYVAGETWSTNFPTTPGAFQTQYGGGLCGPWPYQFPCPDAFVSKLNADGSALVYSTFLGGSDRDSANSIALDASGNAYVVGWTESGNFPVTVGAYDPSFNGGPTDVFVSALNADGSVLLYSTFLGGDWEEYGTAIALDANGAVYATGWTSSSNFPTSPTAFQTAPQGWNDAFVTKLSPDLSALAYSTYLGGWDDDLGYGIAVDGEGAAYLTGVTESSNFPTTPGAFQTTCANDCFRSDAFITKLNASGSALEYSTFLGGAQDDEGRDLAVNASGTAYVAGHTRSSDFPITSGAFQTTWGGGTCFGDPCLDAFVTRLNVSGSGLVYSTYLGGSGEDGGWSEGPAIAVDASGAAYVTGQSHAPDFPTTPGAFQITWNGGNCGGIPCPDAFISKLNVDGSQLLYSTYLGGEWWDEGDSIATDADGMAYVIGYTDSFSFPVTSGAFDPSFNGSEDTFITKLELIPNPLTPTPTRTNTPTPTATPTATPPAPHDVYLPLILNAQ